MGYRFSLINANSVGHLIDGNVNSFIEQSLSNNEYLQPNLEFIEEFILSPKNSFYTSNNSWRLLNGDFSSYRDKWYEIFPDRLKYNHAMFELKGKDERQKLTEILYGLHSILDRCEIKSLLLPGFEYSELNTFLTSEDALIELVKTHPDSSCLILQLKERPSEGIAVLNSFKQFSSAYKKIEQWPGILFWQGSKSIFIPVNSIEQVHEVYNSLKNKGFDSLKDFKSSFSKKKYSYFFHLSDLHFGSEIANQNKSRLIRLLENQRNEIESDSDIYTLITGDLMDSPNLRNQGSYEEFIELFIAKGFKKPIFILGNHDIDTSGFIKALTTQKSVISGIMGTEKIEIIPELNLGIIKFDSNTGGQLAQGEIGEKQLRDMGSLIDKIKSDYPNEIEFIALVHHHPIPIQNPEWYQKDWYEKILGNLGYEETMKLNDSDLFIEWLGHRNIKLVLHGHKHIPKIQTKNGIKVIGAGSSTGVIKHRDKGKTYLSFNVLKYDNQAQKPVHCSIYAEELIGAGTQNILIHSF